MNDREYLKLNTSIQTGSNASELTKDDEGNVEAKIELRLPDSLFQKKSGAKTVDHVAMQTSKMRISLMNTPIAQIPVDEEMDGMDDEELFSTAKLDVYPFTINHRNEILPNPFDPESIYSFPNYKKHTIHWKIYVYLTTVAEPTFIEEYDTNANTFDIFPKTSRWYPVLEKAKIFTTVSDHIMNLSIPQSHEKITDENGIVLVKSEGTLQQMLQDALENAMTYASTESEDNVFVYLISHDIPQYPTLYPSPDPDNTIFLEEYGKTVEYWHYDISNVLNRLLIDRAIKPQVSFSEQTMTIAYDTAPFSSMVPLIWNSSYTNTYDWPVQFNYDTIRNMNWFQPVAKRVMRFGVALDESEGYSFTLRDVGDSALMNIIVNESFKNIFTFLPWIKVDPSKIPELTFNPQWTITKTIDSKNTEEILTSKIQYGVSETADGPYEIKTSGSLASYFGENTDFDAEKPSTLPATNKPWVYCKQLSRTSPSTPYSTVYQVIYIDGYNVSSVQPTITPGIVAEDSGIITRSETVNKIYDKYTIANSDDPPSSSTFERNVSSSTTTSDPTPVPMHSEINTPHIIYYKEIDDSWTQMKYIGDQSANTWDPAKHERWIPTRTEDYFEENVLDQFTTIEYRVWWIPPEVVLITSSHIREMQTLTTTTNVSLTFATTVEESEEASPGTYALTYPNLNLKEDEPFYILDATTANLKIGSQEVIARTGNTSPTYLIETWTNEVDRRQTVQENRFFATQVDASDPRYPGTVDWLKRVIEPVSTTTWNGISVPVSAYYSIIWGYEFNMTDPNQNHKNIYIEWGNLSSESYTSTEDKYVLGRDIISEGPIPDSEPVYTREETSTHQNPGTYEETSSYETQDISETPLEQLPSASTLYFVDLPAPRGIDPSTSSEIFKLEKDVQITYVTEDMDPNSPDNRLPNIVKCPPQKLGERLDITTGKHYVLWGWRQYPTDQSSGIATYKEAGGHTYQFQSTETWSKTHTVKTISYLDSGFYGNLRLTFTWPNLPIVIMSPIQSIVLTLGGVHINNEYQPINIAQPGGSSLTATIPIIENYYSFADTLRDLHDELVVVKEQFDSNPTYTLNTTSGEERTLTISAKYITKDGKIRSIYIPENGVFSIQLTFGISFFFA